MNKQINLIINGKGGVGKSFFATNFVQYLKDCGIAHCAIDSDHENSTLKRFHPQSEFINLEHRREIDRVFTTAETSDLLVIDCRAASTDLFIDFFDEVDFAEVLRSLDARLTVICPVNHVPSRFAAVVNLQRVAMGFVFHYNPCAAIMQRVGQDSELLNAVGFVIDGTDDG